MSIGYSGEVNDRSDELAYRTCFNSSAGDRLHHRCSNMSIAKFPDPAYVIEFSRDQFPVAWRVWPNGRREEMPVALALKLFDEIQAKNEFSR